MQQKVADAAGAASEEARRGVEVQALLLALGTYNDCLGRAEGRLGDALHELEVGRGVGEGAAGSLRQHRWERACACRAVLAAPHWPTVTHRCTSAADA